MDVSGMESDHPKARELTSCTLRKSQGTYEILITSSDNESISSFHDYRETVGVL